MIIVFRFFNNTCIKFFLNVIVLLCYHIGNNKTTHNKRIIVLVLILEKLLNFSVYSFYISVYYLHTVLFTFVCYVKITEVLGFIGRTKVLLASVKMSENRGLTDCSRQILRYLKQNCHR